MTLVSASPRSTDSLSTMRSLQRLHLKRDAQLSTLRISRTASYWRAGSRFAIHLGARRDELPGNADAMKRSATTGVPISASDPADRNGSDADGIPVRMGRRERTQ